MPYFQLKTFQALQPHELYQILQMRLQAFVLDQNCLYQDLDGQDCTAYHAFLLEDEPTNDSNTQSTHLLASLRAFPKADDPQIFCIGRVVSRTKGKGYGSLLLAESLRQLEHQCQPKAFLLAAQCQAQAFYTKQGFLPCSEIFLKDNIPHIWMQKNASPSVRSLAQKGGR